MEQLIHSEFNNADYEVIRPFFYQMRGMEDTNIVIVNFILEKKKSIFEIKKDIVNFSTTLKRIQDSNRYDKTNIQIYLCGISGFLGMPINECLKKLTKQYANVIYVEPTNEKSEESIILSIQKNYALKMAMIDMDRKLKILSINIQLLSDHIKETSEILDIAVSKIFEDNQRYLKKLAWPEFDQINELRDYLVGRYPEDFYDLTKELVYKQINEEKIKFL